jgi:hypothetical protein
MMTTGNSPIFARPRWDYDSYQDMYSLITLSGFPLIYFDEIDPSADETYICTMINGENQHGWQAGRARIIVWDLEWRLQGEPPNIPGVSEMWASDRWYAEQIGARYVPLGSHPGLNPTSELAIDKLFDVTMLAYMTPRRERIANELKWSGLSMTGNAWGEQRHNFLLSSRAMVNVHQHDWAHTTAPQRFALAAAYKLPLISEKACDPGVFADAVLWSEYGALAEFVSNQVRGDLSAFGEALYELLCVEHTFKSEVERAL